VASNNAQVVKNAPGIVYGYDIYNQAGYPIFLKLYNKATMLLTRLPTPFYYKELLAYKRVSTQFTSRNVGLGGFGSGIGLALTLHMAANDNTPVSRKGLRCQLGLPVKKLLLLSAVLISLTGFSVGQQPVVPGAAITKGTQGANGFTTQDLKDSGRTRVTFTADRVTPAATDTLVTFVINVTGTATTGQTTRTVTSGKTFRVQSMHIGVAASTTTAVSVRVALRENTGGTCTASSAAAVMMNSATPAAVAAEGSDGTEMSFPDGLEFPAADSICFSAIGSTSTGTLTVSIVGYEY
jgi:hypothetical protein